jgi:hypothetical protein
MYLKRKGLWFWGWVISTGSELYKMAGFGVDDVEPSDSTFKDFAVLWAL